MNPLSIKSNCSNEFTLVSNYFLDNYMPESNGEFVKIYLYLLRAMSDPASSYTLGSVADTLSCTEKDIERALKYWSKKQVLELEYDDRKNIAGITFLPLSMPSLEEKSSLAVKEAAPTVAQPKPDPVKHTLTSARVKELKKNEDIIQLLFIAEQYLGKTLSPTEISRILYFYEELQFSADLIEYLIEYCVSKGSKSIRYIEKVALSWHEAQITTVEMAKQDSNTYNKHYFAILKALGISNRNPIESEIQMINHWLKDYSFTLDIITEACTRTISQTGKPSFPYADGILTSWNKNGVSCLSDIAKLDSRHKKSKDETDASNTKSKTPNKFNNFPQRDYDFNDLEKQLLKQ